MQHLKKINQKLNAGLLGKASLVAALLSFPVAADHVRDYDQDNPNVQYDTGTFYNPKDDSFRAAHPFRVYVNIRDGGNSNRIERPSERRFGRRDVRRRTRGNTINGGHYVEHGRANNNLGSNYRQHAMQKIARDLPRNIVLVNDPSNADMVVRVIQTAYDLHFRVIDVDHKNKKYKRNQRYTSGQCGVHQRAFYTRIKEKGEANAYYALNFQLNGFEPFTQDVHLRSSEKFSYGKDLRAETNCGMRPTHHLPSRSVAKLFNQSSDGYRHHVVQEIQLENAERLGRQISRRIRDRANQHYSALAGRLSHGTYSENRYQFSEKDKARRWIVQLAHTLIDTHK